MSLLITIGEIDEFKGRWEALGNLAPERLSALKRIATIASVGSSTRIEGVKLTDEEVERLLSGLEIYSFRSRGEQEVAACAFIREDFVSRSGARPRNRQRRADVDPGQPKHH